jgi:hypothetical protein
MFDILATVPGKKKKTQSGWVSFNGVCCHHKGHRPDKRQRAGIRFENDYHWTYNCFNCNFKCTFILGRSINEKTRQLLEWCGVDRTQIERWNLESLQNKDLVEYVKFKREKLKVKFEERKLPEGQILDVDDPSHSKYIEYLVKRKISPTEYPFLVTPNEVGRNANKIVIPYTFQNKIVGHTSRFLDDRKPKYISEQQNGYVFGYDFQKPDWESCIVVEGIFDALSISGCAILHATISDEQAQILRNLNRRIIVVPDQDKTGIDICERALDLGFYVSIPEWDSSIKDVNDAVIKYGKLATALSIIQAATNSKIKIEMRAKKIDKRL